MDKRDNLEASGGKNISRIGDAPFKDSNSVEQCPEFPYFGASYPDARCIEGFLWDLDMCDGKGLYSSGDNPPCPFCNTAEFMKHHHDPLNGVTKKSLVEYVKKLKEKYNYGQ